MKKVTLKEFLKTRTQAEAAQAIGVTEGAISQMKNSNRHIELTIHGDGRIEAHEIKPLGRSKTAA